MALPEKFLKNMQEILSAKNYQNYLDSFLCDRYYGLRVNTSKISVEDFLKISPFELKPVSWCKEGFYYDGKKERPAKHPYYYAGLYYLQEPSAMYPAIICSAESSSTGTSGKLQSKYSYSCLITSTFRVSIGSLCCSSKIPFVKNAILSSV